MVANGCRPVAKEVTQITYITCTRDVSRDISNTRSIILNPQTLIAIEENVTNIETLAFISN